MCHHPDGSFCSLINSARREVRFTGSLRVSGF
jgi:hypothetical protein